MLSDALPAIVFAKKDAFFYVPFGVDVLLCLIQWPLFVYKGPAWLLQTLAGDKAHASPGYLKLYDLFMLCYTAYCALMFYSLYTIASHPDLLPAMACLQASTILTKMALMKKWEGREANNEELRVKKDKSLYTFYLPLYACYFALLHL
jgi:hypothetical protein